MDDINPFHPESVFIAPPPPTPTVILQRSPSMNDYILRVPRRSWWHVVFMHRFRVKMVQNKILRSGDDRERIRFQPWFSSRSWHMQPWVELGKTYFPRWTSLMCTTAVDVNPVMVMAVVPRRLSVFHFSWNFSDLLLRIKANKNRLA